MLVLGLETSCDETGVALYDSERGLLADALFSQIDLHRVYGGVVPELASRDHVKRMLPLIRQVLAEAGREPGQVDAVAYTAGPGLVGALLVGASCAQALALAWGVPAVGVHHMEGHLLAPMLEAQPPAFPFVALLVSGGHGPRHPGAPIVPGPRRIARPAGDNCSPIRPCHRHGRPRPRGPPPPAPGESAAACVSRDRAKRAQAPRRHRRDAGRSG